MAENVYSALLKAWSVAKTSDANVYGVEVAIVTNVQDPEKQGRVKVCFPCLPGKPESTWARVCQPAAGSGRGFYWLPEVSDEVLVAFERGQANLPYVVGALWNGKDKPMKDAYTDDNTTRMIQTKSGHQIVLNDKSGEEKISITDKSGKRTLTWDVKEKKFLVEAKEGDVEIHAKKKLVFHCEDLEIKTKKTGKFEIGTKFDLKVAQKAGFKAGPKMDVKADKVNLNPPSLTLEAVVGAVAGATAGAAAAAAAGGSVAEGAAAGAAAGFEAGGAAGPGGGLVPTKDVVEAAGAGAAAGAAAGKAGAAAPEGSDWTKAKEGQAGSAGGTQGGAGAQAGGTQGGGAGAQAGGTQGGAGAQAGGGAEPAPAPGDVAVTLKDQSGNPASGVAWEVILPDGSKKTGTTGADGKVAVPGGAQSGQYKLVLPGLDGSAPPPAGDGGGAPSGGGEAPSGDGGKPAGEPAPSSSGGEASTSAPKDGPAPGETPADDEAKRYQWVKGIIESTDVRDWKAGKVLGKAIFDTQPWKMNVLALRNWVDGKGVVPNEQNKWNDTFYVAYLDGDGKQRCEAFLGTTDPGKVGAAEVNPNGMAHLLDNQYRFKRGRHHKSRNAMNQAEPFQVWRSKDQHGERKGDEPISTGWFGINNHDAMQSGQTVGNSSEGCQVVWGNYSKPEVCRYFWLMSQDPDGVVRYTLRDGDEVGDAAYASLKPGYEETKARTPRMDGKDDSRWKTRDDVWNTHFFNDSGPKADS